MRRNTRMTNEIKQLQDRPCKGVSCWPVGDDLNHLEACLIGQEETPYANGVFKLDITVPARYPFEPPQVRFCTPIYHPNIDSAGRICLDVLKMPPKGSWKPVHNISTVLKSIHMLMADPNPDDPLMAEIAAEFKGNRFRFNETAKNWTLKYAIDEENKVDSKNVNCKLESRRQNDLPKITSEDAKRKQGTVLSDDCIPVKKPR